MNDLAACLRCGKENAAPRTYCSACGGTVREGASHFSLESHRLIGSIGHTPAVLNLTISDGTYVTGQLAFAGIVGVRVEGWLNGDSALTLELVGSVVDMVGGEERLMPIRMVPALVGKFDRQQFSPGPDVPESVPSLTMFSFAVDQR